MKFAFLVHPRDLNDVFKKYPLLRFFPERIVKFFLKIKSPIVVSKINGLVSQKTGLPANGLLVSIGMTAKEMLDNREMAKTEVIRAVEFSRKLGAKIVGLGALTSPMVNGGADLVGKYNIKITNGNTLTAGMTMVGIKKTIEMNGKIDKQSTFAIVGATGSIGSAISKLIIRDKLTTKMILIGRTQERLSALKDFLAMNLQGDSDLKITTSTDLISLKEADVIVVTTSADSALIKGPLLKRGAIVYDITQPRNTSEMIKTERPDVLVVDGALVKLPIGVGYNFDSGLPMRVNFSCLAETMILAAEDTTSDFSIGDVDIEKVDSINTLAVRYNIEAAPLMSWGEEVL